MKWGLIALLLLSAVILIAGDTSFDGNVDVLGEIQGGTVDSSGVYEVFYTISDTTMKLGWSNDGGVTYHSIGFERIGEQLHFVPTTPSNPITLGFIVDQGMAANAIGVNLEDMTPGFNLEVAGDAKVEHMAIGHSSIPENYALAVNGNVLATEINVLAIGDWPDYVFEDEYDLPTLDEVAAHITEHGTLPGIPSETEVGENGVNLGEMQALTMQKIEELTLYMLELKQENEELRAEIERLKDNR